MSDDPICARCNYPLSRHGLDFECRFFIGDYAAENTSLCSRIADMQCQYDALAARFRIAQEALRDAATWFAERAKQVGDLKAPDGFGVPGAYGIRTALNGYADACRRALAEPPGETTGPTVECDLQHIHGGNGCKTPYRDTSGALAEPPGETTGPLCATCVGQAHVGPCLPWAVEAKRAIARNHAVDVAGTAAPASRDSTRGTAAAKGQRWRYPGAMAGKGFRCMRKWFEIGEYDEQRKGWPIVSCPDGCRDHSFFEADSFRDGTLTLVEPTPPSTKGTCGLCTGSRYICDKGTAGCDATNCRHNRRPCPDCAPKSEVAK